MNSVLFADQDIVVVEGEILQSLRAMAVAAPLRRARLCLHRRGEDPIQEMVIAFARDSYVRPHRHHGKSESFHLMEGSLQVVLFDDAGRVTRRIRLGPPGSGCPTLYRLSCDAWHTVLIESDSVLLHETTNGPFVPGETEFAAWGPDGSQPNDAIAFLQRLRSEASDADPRSVEEWRANHTAMEQSDSVVASAMSRKASPTLTAIICNYNHGRFVSRAIEAMLTQSRPADEFIIIDDGSTDDSASVIRSWVERNPSIRFLQNERNLGFHASFQRAIAAASCDFIYSGAADDRVLPGFFEGAMRMAEEHPKTGVISGQFVSVDPAGQQSSIHKLTDVHRADYLAPARYLREVLKVEPATHSLSGATIFRRQPLLDVGGYRADLGSWGDTFSIQAIGLRHGICYWPHLAMEWTILPGSISQTTRSDPALALRIVDRAAKLMRSDQFRDLFPPNYVKQWERGFRQSIAHEQLHSVIEANQAVQSCCRSIAATANLPTRLLLKFLESGLRAMNFGTFRVLRFLVARRLDRTAAAQRRSVSESGAIPE